MKNDDDIRWVQRFDNYQRALAQLTRIETEIDDLLLPYSVDLSLFKHIDNVNLIDHIQRIGIVFYSR